MSLSMWATLGVGLTQQLIGPLVLDGAISYNVAGDSDFYGDVTNNLFAKFAGSAAPINSVFSSALTPVWVVCVFA